MSSRDAGRWNKRRSTRFRMLWWRRCSKGCMRRYPQRISRCPSTSGTSSNTRCARWRPNRRSLALIRADSIRLNQQHVAGPRAAFARILQEGETIAALDAEPQVRLHGDFFLENIMWRPNKTAMTSEAPQFILVDPVSVAGVMRGPPVFDLVKYVSYATGELPALRSEWVDVGGFDDGEAGYSYRIRFDAPELAPYRTRDWHTRLRRAFEAKYGPVNRRLYPLIDGYFSVAMAVNTGGVQRRARLLKATADFNAVATTPP